MIDDEGHHKEIYARVLLSSSLLLPPDANIQYSGLSSTSSQQERNLWPGRNSRSLCSLLPRCPRCWQQHGLLCVPRPPTTADMVSSRPSVVLSRRPSVPSITPVRRGYSYCRHKRRSSRRLRGLCWLIRAWISLCCVYYPACRRTKRVGGSCRSSVAGGTEAVDDVVLPRWWRSPMLELPLLLVVVVVVPYGIAPAQIMFEEKIVTAGCVFVW